MECWTVPYYNYLCMLFLSRLCWFKYLESYSLKTSGTVCSVQNLFNRRQIKDVEKAFKIFDTKIKSNVLHDLKSGEPVIMLYFTFTLLISNYYDCIENVQIRFCKAYLGLRSSTPNNIALFELNHWLSFAECRMREVKCWSKLLHLNNSSLAKHTIYSNPVTVKQADTTGHGKLESLVVLWLCLCLV